ncbi:hypothetical protein PR048_010126 [Dryococelus australis]|uniref:Uncharacterized protein n=1 Tax=Dryococelus australis TaxID=614101 RepID=A0ABQ9I293_9NEOP|nr:hypothetical protein PR048_010126 [Dryococelus australis]
MHAGARERAWSLGCLAHVSVTTLFPDSGLSPPCMRRLPRCPPFTCMSSLACTKRRPKSYGLHFPRPPLTPQCAGRHKCCSPARDSYHFTTQQGISHTVLTPLHMGVGSHGQATFASLPDQRPTWHDGETTAEEGEREESDDLNVHLWEELEVFRIAAGFSRGVVRMPWTACEGNGGRWGNVHARIGDRLEVVGEEHCPLAILQTGGRDGRAGRGRRVSEASTCKALSAARSTSQCEFERVKKLPESVVEVDELVPGEVQMSQGAGQGAMLQLRDVVGAEHQAVQLRDILQHQPPGTTFSNAHTPLEAHNTWRTLPVPAGFLGGAPVSPALEFTMVPQVSRSEIIGKLRNGSLGIRKVQDKPREKKLGRKFRKAHKTLFLWCPLWPLLLSFGSSMSWERGTGENSIAFPKHLVELAVRFEKGAEQIQSIHDGGGKREIPEKTRRSVALSGAIPTCKNPGGMATRLFGRASGNLSRYFETCTDIPSPPAKRYLPRRPSHLEVVGGDGLELAAAQVEGLHVRGLTQHMARHAAQNVVGQAEVLEPAQSSEHSLVQDTATGKSRTC